MNYRLLVVAFLIVLSYQISTLNSKQLSQATSKKRQSERESDGHKLTAHPFLNKEQLKEQNQKAEQSAASKEKSNKKQTDKQKQQAQKELGSEWHIYYILMIISTLGGMKTLDILQKRIKHKTPRQGHTQIPSRQISQEYDFSN